MDRTDERRPTPNGAPEAEEEDFGSIAAQPRRSEGRRILLVAFNGAFGGKSLRQFAPPGIRCWPTRVAVTGPAEVGEHLADQDVVDPRTVAGPVSSCEVPGASDGGHDVLP
jgi:hypothetical protein